MRTLLWRSRALAPVRRAAGFLIAAALVPLLIWARDEPYRKARRP